MGVARGRCRATGVVAGVLACVLAVAPSASADPSSVAGGASECVPDRSTIAQCFPDKALAQAIAKQVKGDAGKTGEVLTSKDVKGVSYLDFSNSQVASVQGLQVFANLGSMYLFGTRVSDVSPLAGLTKLTALYLSDTKVSDATLPSIAKLPNLQWLDLSGTQVSNVSPLAKMTKLEYLNLSGTQVSNVSPLAKMTKLEYLNLSGTQV
ncbi:leucine-rich repeat domain-containing protein, partial [Bifidobacterium thermophilum]